MDIERAVRDNDLVLTEAGNIEALRRKEGVHLHGRLENSLMIYDRIGKMALSELYNGFISIAHREEIPITLSTPTWKANHERIVEAGINKDVNGDAFRFIDDIREGWGAWKPNIGIAGLTGCKNDCYLPDQGLSAEEAKDFHSWQVQRLAEAGVDFLLAETLPAISEAIGMALAMEDSGIPYIISFVINRRGYVLDGTSLEEAFDCIDSKCARPPLGYMVNCAYPSFIKAESQPDAVFGRLIGYQANASSLDHALLDRAETPQSDDVRDWGERMIELNRRYGVKILGGCCGTDFEHLEYMVRHRKNR